MVNVNKMVYQNLMGQNKNARNDVTKWENILNINTGENKWKKIYIVNFQSCIESSFIFYCLIP